MKSKSLRIGILASNLVRIPPRPQDLPPGFSGAVEAVVSTIIEGLMKRGHRTTLFASGDSKTDARLVAVTNTSTFKNPNIGFKPNRSYFPYELMLASKAFMMAKEGAFDIINSHVDFVSAYFSPFSAVPVITTLHSPLIGVRYDVLKFFGRHQRFVSISNAQRKPLPRLNWAATIHHGIDTASLAWTKTPKGDYIIVGGRIHPTKGIKEAILAAKKARMKLIIIGSHAEDEYWNKTIQPLIDQKQITYKGLVSREKALALYRNARAFLFPIQWEEPFGLVMIEAMACGTPVIAFNRGSVPEIIKDGKTGFIINTMEEMAEAIKKIDQIDRRACREHVEKNFSLEKMIDEYERVFLRLVEKER
jgi:glycosyltransferase involved in cell wall biosynthesis